MEKVFYTRHNDGITLFLKGRSSLVMDTHINFNKILAALRAKKFDKLEELMNIGQHITKNGVGTHGRRVFVRDGAVFYVDSHKKERELDGILVDRVLTTLSNDNTKFADSLLNFLDNLMKNKKKDIRKELYEWLMSGAAPITADGCFLAYKKVRSDFFDIYTGTLDNSPGKVVTMKQDDVDTDRTNTCSTGLHFCSRGYLQHYGGESGNKIVIVKVNPRHVFAIPVDYDFQKGRASQYFVVGEFKGKLDNEAFKDTFIDEDTKKVVAPDVQFIDSMKPTLKATAESYGLVVNGQVAIYEGTTGDKIAMITKGKQFFCTPDEKLKVSADKVKFMSFETKSVREAVKKAVKIADKVYLG